MIQFILSLVLATLGVSGVSLLWPKFISNPMPEPLKAVRSIVMQTPLGMQVDNVLGVSTESQQNINPSELVASAASSFVNEVEQKSTELVIDQLLLQLNRQIDRLPIQKQEQIRRAMCIGGRVAQ